MRKLVQIYLPLLLFVGSLTILQSCRGKSLKRSGKEAGSIDTELVPGGSGGPGGGGGSIETSPPGLNLVWKRYRAFESGLMQALGLTKEQLCVELGQFSCIDKIHLTVLGGNEPYQMGQYERSLTPTALTPVAVDRIVLSACSKRLELDRAAGGSAVVFKSFALSGAAPGPDQLKLQATELYRRILARDPLPEELSIVEGFAGKMPSADKAALGLCFAIGSSSENIFL